jgi:hypothetical protein
MTEAEARVLLRDCGGFGGLEAWIAARTTCSIGSQTSGLAPIAGPPPSATAMCDKAAAWR